MRELIEVLTQQSERVPLDLASLQMASIEYPGLEPGPYILLIDSYARELGERLSRRCSGEDFVATMNEYMFDELGFNGNEEDYYDPTNSCLNDVLTHRCGLPITLAVVCLEIARRLAQPLYGVGLPGHFLLLYKSSDFETYIDPFNNGQLLFEPECYEIARKVTGIQYPDDPMLLAPVNNRQILMRMLNNLRSAYLLREDPQRLLKVLDLIIAASPNSAEDYKQRGVIRGRLQMFQSCASDLQKYIELAPNAGDREEVLEYLKSIQKWRKSLQ